MNLFQKLQAIQCELDVPKSQYNSFGKYYYRNAEDILAAVKPMLKKHNCVLQINDKLIVDGDRHYIQASVTLYDTEADDMFLRNSALAREEETKKGMDAAQITGSASSYARKYALNGMFCLDDVKDADHSKTNHQETTKQDFDEAFTAEDGRWVDSQTVDNNCQGCNKELTKSQKQLSLNKYGKPLCPKCQKEGNNE